MASIILKKNLLFAHTETGLKDSTMLINYSIKKYAHVCVLLLSLNIVWLVLPKTSEKLETRIEPCQVNSSTIRKRDCAHCLFNSLKFWKPNLNYYIWPFHVSEILC